MAIYKTWAHKCAYPTCNSLVSYHNKGSGSGSGPFFKFKTFCNHHRKGAGKAAVDNWKITAGCRNAIHQHHGIKCTSHITTASGLDINHIDGDRRNSDPDNIEVLCKMCHQHVTISNGHHRTRYTNQVRLDPALFEYDL
jgi:hypothetical protein